MFKVVKFPFLKKVLQLNNIVDLSRNAQNLQCVKKLSNLAVPESLKENEKTANNQQNGEKFSFAQMLKESLFIQMGDPNGVVVVGTIIETMDDNLFIDFGAKFHCVCKKPRYKTHLYTRGTEVKLRLIDLELASKFMGSEKGISLLEADAVLLGLHNDETSTENQSRRLDRQGKIRRIYENKNSKRGEIVIKSFKEKNLETKGGTATVAESETLKNNEINKSNDNIT